MKISLITLPKFVDDVSPKLFIELIKLFAKQKLGSNQIRIYLDEDFETIRSSL